MAAEGELFAEYKGHKIFIDEFGNLIHAPSGYFILLKSAPSQERIEEYMESHLDRIIAEMKRRPRLRWGLRWDRPTEPVRSIPY